MKVFIINERHAFYITYRWLFRAVSSTVRLSETVHQCRSASCFQWFSVSTCSRSPDSVAANRRTSARALHLSWRSWRRFVGRNRGGSRRTRPDQSWPENGQRFKLFMLKARAGCFHYFLHNKILCLHWPTSDYTGRSFNRTVWEMQWIQLLHLDPGLRLIVPLDMDPVLNRWPTGSRSNEFVASATMDMFGHALKRSNIITSAKNH